MVGITQSYANTNPPEPAVIYLSDVTHDFAVLNGSNPHTLNLTGTNTTNSSIDAVGYPGNRADDSGPYRLWFMFRSPSEIQSFNAGAIVHTSHVTGGQSAYTN
ncbi:hypothetical protein HXA35_16855 [Bacillus sp. A301a_S52]|jgi:hypothetical protein|nr:hypothetical protein [Bacillus sp. A301a_S52]